VFSVKSVAALGTATRRWRCFSEHLLKFGMAATDTRIPRGIRVVREIRGYLGTAT